MPHDYIDAELKAAYAEPPPERHQFWRLQHGDNIQLIGDIEDGTGLGTEAEAKQRFVNWYCCRPEEIEVIEYYEKNCEFEELAEEEQEAVYFFDENR